MFAKACLAMFLIAAWAIPSAAQLTEPTLHIELQQEEPQAASPQCSLGIVYDDGGFNDAYSIGNGDPGDATAVMKFDLPAGTTALDQVCACFTRMASAPSSMNFEVVVYNDNGPSGQPGTFLGAVNATASFVPIYGATQFYSVDLSGAPITLPDTSVYIGVRWPGGGLLLCGDRTSTTTQRTNYGSANGGVTWTSTATLFPTAPPRALGVRVDPRAGSATCIPSSTALCLNSGRFKVEATYQALGQPVGTAQVVKLTDETGYLWFFNSSNVETVVKVLNGCSLNSRFWVFAGGLTDVRVDLRVTDTKNGTFKTYVNPLGTPFQPIQDTAALATCP